MDRVILDDCVYALVQCFHYYGKELDDIQLTFWKKYILTIDAVGFKRCLATHIERSQYAPKIANIKDLMAELSTRSKPMYQEAKVLPVREATPEVARAWMWYISTCKSGGITEGLFSSSGTDDHDLIEQHLSVINNQCANSGNWLGVDRDHAFPENLASFDRWAQS